MALSDPIFYKTTDLSLKQKNEICALFERIFHKRKSLEDFDRQFLNTCMGYSYHAVIEQDGVIVAAHSSVPYLYKVGEGEKCFSLNVDSMVTPKIGIDGFAIFDMVNMIEDHLREDNVLVCFGFPNDNFYEYSVKVGGRTHIGILDFYVLPVNMGMIKSPLRCFDGFMRFCARQYALLSSFGASSKPINYPIQKVDDEVFRRQRYSDIHQHIVLKDGCDVFYRLYEEEGLGKIAYIIDISKLSAKNFYRAFYAVAKAVRKEASLVAYPSRLLPFKTLLHIPLKKLPRKIHMIGRVLKKGVSNKEFYFDYDNWNINLSNFDTR